MIKDSLYEMDNLQLHDMLNPHYIFDNIYKLNLLDNELITYKKLDYYKKTNQEAKFRLVTKPHYEISGLISELKDGGVVINNKDCSIFIQLTEIDPSTIIPKNYNAIVYLNYDPVSEEDRAFWFGLYNGLCAYKLPGCSIKAEAIDHVFPRVLGGGSNRENLRPICNHCNSVKGIRTDIIPYLPNHG